MRPTYTALAPENSQFVWPNRDMNFRLRTIFYSVGLFAVGLAAFDHVTRNSRWRIVRELEHIGVATAVFRSRSTNDLDSVVLATRIRRRGLSRFGQMHSIDATALENPDEDLALIVDVHVGALNLAGTCLTDDGISHIGRMPHVGILYLSNTQITDNAMDEISSIDGLWCVLLKGTAVTPSGLARLSFLRPDLYIEHDSVTMGIEPEQASDELKSR